MREERFFNRFSVLEIERNGIYEYYLSKKDCANLYFMYGTEEKCFPSQTTVLEYIKFANTVFWVTGNKL